LNDGRHNSISYKSRAQFGAIVVIGLLIALVVSLLILFVRA
jgi:hypothetical protein